MNQVWETGKEERKGRRKEGEKETEQKKKMSGETQSNSFWQKYRKSKFGKEEAPIFFLVSFSRSFQLQKYSIQKSYYLPPFPEWLRGSLYLLHQQSWSLPVTIYGRNKKSALKEDEED